MIENFLKEETISQDYYCGKCKRNLSVYVRLQGMHQEAIFISIAADPSPADQAILLRQVLEAEDEQPHKGALEPQPL